MKTLRQNGITAITALCLALGGLLCFLSAFPAGEYAGAPQSPRNGLLLAANAFLSFLTRKTGRIHLLFACTPNRDYLFLAVFLFLFVFLICFFSLRRTILPTLLLAVGVSLGYGFGLFPSGVGFLVFCVGFLLALTQRRRAEEPWKSFLCRAVSVAVCLSVLFAVLPAQSAPRETLQTKLCTQLHRLRYESGDPLPEGDLLRDTAPNKSDETALLVQTERGGRMYLRGFVGERFDGLRWAQTPNEELAAYADLFYWLHRYGFSSAVQPALALQQAGMDAAQTVRVTSVSACKQYAFVPLAGEAAELFDPASLHDGVWLADGKPVTAQVPLFEKGTLFAAQKAIAAQRGTDYLKWERAYAQFVRETMLDIPQAVRVAFQRQIDVRADAPLAEKICFVLDWLSEYNETASPQPFSGDDAVVWFLEQSKSGSDAMFATAAALMLRYLEVPARYAEGYAVSAAVGETAVKKADARVWTEYYLDGVGWVPLETVPGRAQEERQFYSAYTSDGLTENALRRAEVRQPQNPMRPGKTPRGNHTALRIIFCCLAAVLFAMLVLILARRLRFRAKMRRIRALPIKERIAALYAYAQRVRGACGLERRDDNAFALYEEALFSDHVMTQEHLQTMQTFADETVAACRRADRGLRKIKRYFWDCIY